jgi:signal transduction histidine kinase
MPRALLAYVLLVLLPCGALALLAFRAAEADHAERAAALQAEVSGAARALALRAESAVADAARRAAAEELVAYARDGRWIGYAPDDAPAAESATPEEERLYRLAVEGGEDFEHARRDPARALDAYAFYLPRLRSPLLRARLEHRAARVLLAEGGTGRRALGEALLRGVFAAGEGLATEEGLPIDLLAAARLLEAAPPPGPEFRAAARERLASAAPRLPTHLLARLAAAIAPADEGLRAAIEKRRALEAAVARRQEVLSSAHAAIDGGFLLVAGPSAAAPGLREVRLARLDLPPLDAPGLTARLDVSGPAASPASPGAASAPVRLAEGAPPIAAVLVEDPAWTSKLAALGKRRTVARALVGLLVLSTLAGGAALAFYLARERRLARLRAALVANVSHELKTPVTSIRMFAEMLAQDPVSGEQVERFAGHLQAESLRLGHLVEELLDLSRLGRAGADLPREPVDLAPLLGRVAAGFAHRAREEGVAFRAVGLPDGPANGSGVVLATNGAAVERIVLNLLDNALKYRRRDGARIDLSLERGGGRARITVADNGPGVPRADRERVFEEFYRVRYDDYAVKGSGLGLAIARRLARKLGGEVILESREGDGSTFTLELPPGEEAHEPGAHPRR